MLKIAVNGAVGKMGARILALAHEQPNEFKVVQAFDLDSHAGKMIPAGVLLEGLSAYAKGEKKLSCDVLIDFSGPEGTRLADAAVRHSGIKGLVVGSTGLDDAAVKSLQGLGEKTPVVLSSNMSVGVNLVLEVLELLAKKLPKEFNIEITEAHHRHKKDSPSGTALMLAEAIAKAKNWDLKKTLRYRGAGQTGERPEQEIGMQVIRAGEIIGDHTVLFAGPSETIEVTHHAQSRDTFARGALIAAQFAARQNKGFFRMADVLK